MTTPTLAAVVDALQQRFPPALAESWDRVGLVCGDPAAQVRRVLFAVDPTLAVADEAVGSDSQLLVTHHPLLLRGVHSVAAVVQGVQRTPGAFPGIEQEQLAGRGEARAEAGECTGRIGHELQGADT